MKNIFYIILFFIYNNAVGQNLTIPEDIDNKCFTSSTDSIHYNGCGNFLLYKQLHDYPNYVVIVEANGLLLKNDTCYEMNIDDLMFEKLSFKVYTDMYAEDGFQKTYCGCMRIANAVTPIKINCISGKLKCIIESVKIGDLEKEVITLELLDAEFKFDEAQERITKYSLILFNKVVIGSWDG